MTEGRTSLIDAKQIEVPSPPHHILCVCVLLSFLPSKQSNKIIKCPCAIYLLLPNYFRYIIYQRRQTVGQYMEMGRIHGSLNGKKGNVVKMANEAHRL